MPAREDPRSERAQADSARAESSSAWGESPALGESELASALARLRQRSSGPERYAVRGLIARGPMSTVLKVWDADLARELAMKLVEPPSPGADAEVAEEQRSRMARFLQEARIAAQLDHPGIVPVHELGVDAQGRLYFTMPLIRGRHLGEALACARAGEEGWNLPRVVVALLRACDAVAYAHTRGIVHRDLKPGNILVGPFGEVHVVDWGLALARAPRESQRRVREGLAAEEAAALLAGLEPTLAPAQIVGTPGYMAPELAQGRAAEADARADVYSLGAILYEALCGLPPHAALAPDGQPRVELERVREDPPRDVRELVPDAPRELAAICRKATARAPARRYASARELAADLRAHLEGHVVAAYRPGPIARARKWAARNRSLALALEALLAAGLVFACVLLWREGDRRSALAAEQARTASKAYAAGIGTASASLRAGASAEARARLEECPVEPRAFEWRHLMLAADEALYLLPGQEGADGALAWSPAGDWLLAVGQEGRAELRAASSPEQARRLACADGPLSAAAFDALGARCATAGKSGKIRVWSVPGGAPLVELDFAGEHVTALAFAPDGRSLAAGSWESGSIALFDLGAAQRVLVLRAHASRISGLAYAPDGQRLYSSSWDTTLAAWRPSNGAELARVKAHDQAIRSLALSHDGSLVASCSAEGRLCLWDTRADGLTLCKTLPDQGAPLFAVAFSPDDRRVASGDSNGTIALWDIEDSGPIGLLRGHHGGVGSLAYSMRTGWLASSSADGSLRLWSGEPRASFVLRGSDPQPRVLAWMDAERLLTGGGDRLVAWDASGGRAVASASLPAEIRALSVSPVQRAFAVGLADGALITLAWPALTPLADVDLGAVGLTALCYSADGAWIAAGFADGTLRRVRAADAAISPATPRAAGQGSGLGWTARPFAGSVVGVASDPKGAWIAVVGEEGSLALLDAVDGAPRAGAHADCRLFAAARSPDGQLLAVACGNGSVLLWSLPGLDPAGELGPASSLASALAWDSGGTRLACADATGAVRLWDVESRRALLHLEGGVDYGEALAFAPDSSALALASGRGGVRLWRAPVE